MYYIRLSIQKLVGHSHSCKDLMGGAQGHYWACPNILHPNQFAMVMCVTELSDHLKDSRGSLNNE